MQWVEADAYGPGHWDDGMGHVSYDDGATWQSGGANFNPGTTAGSASGSGGDDNDIRGIGSSGITYSGVITSDGSDGYPPGTTYQRASNGNHTNVRYPATGGGGAPAEIWGDPEQSSSGQWVQRSNMGNVRVTSAPPGGGSGAVDANGDGFNDANGLPFFNGISATMIGGKIYYQGQEIDTLGRPVNPTDTSGRYKTVVSDGSDGFPRGTIYQEDTSDGSRSNIRYPSTTSSSGSGGSSGFYSPSFSSGGSSGGGGGSTNVSTRTGGYNNTDTNYNYSTSNSTSFNTSDIGPNSMANSAADRAQRASEFAATHGLSQSKEARDKAALYAQLLSTVDPNAYAAFLSKMGGGALQNAIGSGGDALSENALRPAAMVYGGDSGGGGLAGGAYGATAFGDTGVGGTGGASPSPAGVPADSNAPPDIPPAPVDPYAQYGPPPAGFSSWQEWGAANPDNLKLTALTAVGRSDGKGGQVTQDPLALYAALYQQRTLNPGTGQMHTWLTAAQQREPYLDGTGMTGTGAVTPDWDGRPGPNGETYTPYSILNNRGQIVNSIDPKTGYARASNWVPGPGGGMTGNYGPNVGVQPGQYIGGGQYAPAASGPTTQVAGPVVPQATTPQPGNPADTQLVPGYAYGRSMTRAPQMIVGDPQRDGRPNPEMIHNPTNAPISVVPLRAMQRANANARFMAPNQRTGGLPRYAYGTTTFPMADTDENGNGVSQTADSAPAGTYDTDTTASIKPPTAPIVYATPTAPTAPTALPPPPPSQIGAFSTDPANPGTVATQTTTAPTNTSASLPGGVPGGTMSPPWNPNTGGMGGTAPAPPVSGGYIPQPQYPYTGGGTGGTGGINGTAPAPSASGGYMPQPQYDNGSIQEPGQREPMLPPGASGGLTPETDAVKAQRLAAALPPGMTDPNAFMNVDYQYLDPTVKDMYEQYLQIRYGIPVASTRAAAERFALRSGVRGNNY